MSCKGNSNICSLILCQNGGVCYPSTGQCICPNNWTGPDCRISVVNVPDNRRCPPNFRMILGGSGMPVTTSCGCAVGDSCSSDGRDFWCICDSPNVCTDCPSDCTLQGRPAFYRPRSPKTIPVCKLYVAPTPVPDSGPPATQASSATSLPREENSKTSIPFIVGIASGAVVFIIIVSTIGWFLFRKRTDSQNNQQTLAYYQIPASVESNSNNNSIYPAIPLRQSQITQL